MLWLETLPCLLLRSLKKRHRRINGIPEQITRPFFITNETNTSDLARNLCLSWPPKLYVELSTGERKWITMSLTNKHGAFLGYIEPDGLAFKILPSNEWPND